jgi:hypothetical protein
VGWGGCGATGGFVVDRWYGRFISLYQKMASKQIRKLPIQVLQNKKKVQVQFLLGLGNDGFYMGKTLP